MASCLEIGDIFFIASCSDDLWINAGVMVTSIVWYISNPQKGGLFVRLDPIVVGA